MLVSATPVQATAMFGGPAFAAQGFTLCDATTSRCAAWRVGVCWCPLRPSGYSDDRRPCVCRAGLHLVASTRRRAHLDAEYAGVRYAIPGAATINACASTARAGQCQADAVRRLRRTTPPTGPPPLFWATGGVVMPAGWAWGPGWSLGRVLGHLRASCARRDGLRGARVGLGSTRRVRTRSRPVRGGPRGLRQGCEASRSAAYGAPRASTARAARSAGAGARA